jgi:probable F420-dependent oxidoreductase
MKFTLFPLHIPADQLLSVGKTADVSGYHAMTLSDSVFYPETVTSWYPYSGDGLRPWGPDAPHADPFVAIPAVAACTERLHFFTTVMKASLRQPLLVAKTLGTAAAMFPGRIGLGVGTSWMAEEFEWLNEDMKSRGARLDEMIEIIRRCLSPGWAEFHGKYYNFDRLIMSPVPERPVPIYVGGHAAPALRRAAILGDGWIPAGADPEELKVAIPRLLQMRADGPRASEPFEVIACIMDPPDLDGVAMLEELGVTNLAVRPYPKEALTADEKCRFIVEFAENVIQKRQACP